MLIDAHCHIATDFDDSETDSFVECYSKLSGVRFVVMSTNAIDVEYVDALSRRLGNIFPSFGVHPWYSHLFTLQPSGTQVDKAEHYRDVFGKLVDDELLSVLPPPIHFDEHVTKLLSLFSRHKHACWGEIGLDKLFRIPSSGFFANPAFKGLEPSLTKYRVSMEHQRAIFTQQLSMAFERGIPVSIHNVKTSGAIHDIIKSQLTAETRSAVCLHSYTGSVDTLKMFVNTFKKRQHARFFASFSSVINNCGPKKDELAQFLEVLPAECVLSETDVTLDRFIGEGGPLVLLEEIVEALGVEKTILEQNCLTFLGMSSF